MQNLRYGDSGPIVEQIQTALNFAGPTRLPRLPIDGQFGALTVARVMEFQSFNDLAVDGVVGSQTNGRLPQDGPGDNQQPDPSQGRSILVDLYDRELTAYDNGSTALHISPISGGRPGYQSTPGVFEMTSRRLRRHSSSEFPGKDNMDFSLFYHEGEAIHQGDPNVKSHGCIHVPAPLAEQRFLTDLLSDSAEGYAIYRFQVLAWTLVLGFIFISLFGSGDSDLRSGNAWVVRH
jgi:hypothetical protein